MGRSTIQRPVVEKTPDYATAIAENNVAATAGYIAEMSAELAKMAGSAQLPMLAYFLNLARVEAEMRLREQSRQQDKRGE